MDENSFFALCDAIGAIEEKYSYKTSEASEFYFHSFPIVEDRGDVVKITIPASLTRTAGYIMLGDTKNVKAVEYKGAKLLVNLHRLPGEKPNYLHLRNFADDLISKLPGGL